MVKAVRPVQPTIYFPEFSVAFGLYRVRCSALLECPYSSSSYASYVREQQYYYDKGSDWAHHTEEQGIELNSDSLRLY